jgi:predicted Zn-dependent protease
VALLAVLLGRAVYESGAPMERVEELARKGVSLDSSEPLGWRLLAEVEADRGRSEAAAAARARAERLERRPRPEAER